MTVAARLSFSFVTASIAAIASISPAATADLPATITTPPAPFTAAMHWRSIGPAIGGRVVAVAGVPGKGMFYMGAVDGGVWRSTNYG
ncbi:MAG TPA: hypothetical protein VEJ20_05220, partial [Candidatus Eremiobacteraceae bacterium]|nr:hypothetical protein [Candidatus Eremiobacteraceae bacterium]